MVERWVLDFFPGVAAGPGQAGLLGKKGRGLLRAAAAGLPVPAGFVITTEVHRLWQSDPGEYRRRIPSQIEAALTRLQRLTGTRLGDPKAPLLLSLRSSPGQVSRDYLGALLNLGLNPTLLPTLAVSAGEGFAYDCYRRLLAGFAGKVFQLRQRDFTQPLIHLIQRRQVSDPSQLAARDWQWLIDHYLKSIQQHGFEFPLRPADQLAAGIEAFFGASRTSALDSPIALVVQQMVFGNRQRSGCGLAFSRDPATGEKKVSGSFIPHGQGEDFGTQLVQGLPLQHIGVEFGVHRADLESLAQRLESLSRKPQEFEFTADQGRLYLLQSRSLRVRGAAAVRIALELQREGLSETRQTLLSLRPRQLKELIGSKFRDKGARVVGRGLGAAPGAAVGRVVFEADQAVKLSRQGEPVILIQTEVTSSDLHGVTAAEGVVSVDGGLTSHAAILARGQGKCCVVACEDLRVDPARRELQAADLILREGDEISLDGTHGRILLGALEAGEPDHRALLEHFIELTDSIGGPSFRASANDPKEVLRARRLGAVGVGVCRTERMFLREPQRRRLATICSQVKKNAQRQAWLELRSLQAEHYWTILDAMDGFPVAFRIVSTPLGELLPEHGNACVELQQELILSQIEALGQATRQLLHAGKSPRPEVIISPSGAGVEEIRGAVSCTLNPESGLESCPLGMMVELPGEAARLEQGQNALDFILVQLDPSSKPPSTSLLQELHAGGKVGVEFSSRQAPDVEWARWFLAAKLDYFSCSPDQVPLARLAFAQAALQ